MIDKLKSILESEDVVFAIRNNIDELLLIIPEIKYMINFDHKHPHHHLDVFNHTLLALSMSKNDFEIRLCLLLHDIGKPFSYQEDNEIRHYKNHGLVSANMSKVILNRIGFEEDFINEVYYLIRNHDYPISKNMIINNYELMQKLFEIQECDALAHNPMKLEKRKLYLQKIRNNFKNI